MQWEGKGPEHNIWEAVDSLEGCEALIAQYWSSVHQAQATGPQPVSLRRSPRFRVGAVAITLTRFCTGTVRVACVPWSRRDAATDGGGQL